MGSGMDRIGVVGAGQMGAGIAHVAALAGKQVTLVDVEDAYLARGLSSIRKNLGRQVEKGKVAAEARDAALERITTTTDLEALTTADLAVEAVVEDERIKRDLFARLDAVTQPSAILASNTSSISITRLAAATKRPENVIGMHFMNPVPVMALVEVIRGIATSDETSARVVEAAKEMAKTPVECRDFPGFVS
ncbi:MAG TPA: 3-hydroxyacyl-CoA dehydrogenase NAD-binding domain-containing protein, partial [Thermoanaerobaculia bacterium]|nr:3-hydroxyacyl-CoA dehydrogenase NAD-binding domain-containing protein [Thermoanaerobaculia bacterium]